MNTNRKFAALATLTTLITIGAGVFVFSNSSSGSTAPADPATAQEVTIKAHDTTQAPLSGVAVQVKDAKNIKVAGGTTRTNGEISLSFNPDPGTYIVTAIEPTGYRAQNDKDGKVSQTVGPSCQSVYLCIYLTATEVQDNAGVKTVELSLTHVRHDQIGELDDLWFEMEAPAAAEEETSFIDPADDETFIGEAGNDSLITEPGSDVLIGSGDNDDLLRDSVDETDERVNQDILDEVIVTGLSKLCLSVEHGRISSDVLVSGEVDGVDDGTIFVQGPTINNGDPVQIPISDGVFDGPLGINQYGDHVVDLFEVQGSDTSVAPINLIPTINTGPGTIFPVDSNEGPIFDNECFDFDAAPIDATDLVPTAVPEQTADEQVAEALTEARAKVQAFVDGFVEDHINADVAGLIDTLHPAVPVAFGEATCSEYVTRTTGSITGATVFTVEAPQSVDMDTPNGPITFPEAIPFTVEFSLGDGTTLVNDAHLAQHDGESHWLTRCGVGG